MENERILELYIARHAETWGNRSEKERIDNGRQSDRESLLTEKGIRQAELLGERLSVGALDAVFASSLIRTVGTAYEVTARQKNRDLKIEILPDLIEIGTRPDYTGYPADEIIAMYPNAVPCVSEPSPAGGRLSIGVEDDGIVLKRAERCISYFRNRFRNGEKVLVVAHGSFNTFLIRAALGLDNSSNFTFSQENTALTKINYLRNSKGSDDLVKLAYSNDTSHLFAQMPDYTYIL